MGISVQPKPGHWNSVLCFYMAVTVSPEGGGLALACCVLAAAVACLAGAAPAVAAVAPAPPRAEAAQSRAAGSSAIRFASPCAFSHRAPDDPILHPFAAGRSHSNDFFGNFSADSTSSYEELRGAGGTRCRRGADRSAYWVPTLFDAGRTVTPVRVQAFYLTGRKDPVTIRPFPKGLKMVAGDAGALAPQDPGVVTWRCSGRPPSTQVPWCPFDSHLVLRVRFPDCWNGRHTGSSRSVRHMAYSRAARPGGGRRVCPRGNRVPVPELVLDAHYPIAGGEALFLSSGGPHAVRAGFFNGWDQGQLNRLVRGCLRAKRRCGVVAGAPIFQAPAQAPAQAQAPGPAASRTASHESRSRFPRGRFSDPCGFSHRAPDDPIVHPFAAARSHSHDFFGNFAADSTSSHGGLRIHGTRCRRQANRSSYWVPTLYLRGRAIKPQRIQVYYLGNGRDPAAIQPFPANLSMIAGYPGPQGPPDMAAVSWRCSSGSPLEQRDVALCRRGARLVKRLRFPDCWDGVHTDSPDHFAHMAHSLPSGRNRACPASHPVAVPMITVNVHYPFRGGSGVTLASGPAYTGHGDYMNGWDQATLADLVERCLRAGVRCGAGPRG